MTEMAEHGTWRVAWGPGQDDDEDEWLVVFRLDPLGRDAEGPQVVVMSTAETEYDAYDPEADVTYDVEYSYTTSFDFQIWGPDKDLIAMVNKQAPYSCHNWAVDLNDAREQAIEWFRTSLMILATGARGTERPSSLESPRQIRS